MSAHPIDGPRPDRGHAARAHSLRAVPLLAQRVATIGVPVVVGILVSRHLGDRPFGQFSIVLVTVSGLQIVSEFGLDKFLPREFVEREDASGVFRDWLGFRVTLALALYVFALAGAFLVGADREVLIAQAVYGSTLFSAAYASTCRSYYVAAATTWLIGAAAIVGGVLSLIASAALLRAGVESLALVAAPLTIGSLIELVILAQFLPTTAWLRPRRTSFIARIASTWEFGWQTLASVLYTRVGIYVLGFVGGSLTVATYARASLIYSSLSLVPAAAAAVIYPALVRAAKQGDRPGFSRVFTENLLHLVILLVPLDLVLMAFGGPLLALIYRGGVAAESVSALRILLVAFLIIIVNSVLAVGLFALHAQRQVAKLSVLSLGFCTIANFILVPYASAKGAAWATLLSEAATAMLFVPALWSRVRELRVADPAMNEAVSKDADACRESA